MRPPPAPGRRAATTRLAGCAPGGRRWSPPGRRPCARRGGCGRGRGRRGRCGHGARRAAAGRAGVAAAQLVQQPGGELGVAAEAGAGETGGLALACREDPRPDGGRRRCALGAQGRGGRPRDRDRDVDPVEQRPAETTLVLRKIAGAAAAGRLPASARARVRRGHERDPRRKAHHPLRPDDRDRAVLQWLAQRLERRPRELGQLVEEEHPMVGERRLTGSRADAAADEARGGDRVMRGAERTSPDQAARAVQAGDRVQPGHLDRLVTRERRQQAGQPARQHRLARARRAVEEEVVPAGGRHLQRGDEAVVAAHVREVRLDALEGFRCFLLRRRRRGAVAAQDLDRLLQIVDAQHLDRPDEGRFACPRARYEQPGKAMARGALGDGERSAHRPDLAHQRQLADHGAARDRVVGQLPARRQDRNGQGEVEARADLAQVGRCEVDRDPAVAERRSRNWSAPSARARAPRAPPCRRARRP